MVVINIAILLVLLAIGLAIYFLPAIIARSRDHDNKTAIFVLNLLLGWSVIGWVGAMVWAFTNSTAAPEPEPSWMQPRPLPAGALGAMREPEERACPFCAELIKAKAKVCKHCGRDVEPIGNV